MYHHQSGGYLLIIAIGFLAICPRSSADIALPKLFSDHMVLQQNQSMRVWGTADPDEKLTVSFAKQSVKTTADKNGLWSAIIGTGPAGGPYQMEIASEDSETKVVFHDVLVGEVWICGGQSNMQFPLSQVPNAEAEIDAAKGFPTIRAFDVDHNASAEPLKDFAKVDSWFCCSPDSIKQFSAVAYFFGRELRKKLDVPIGLINVSRDGTTLEAWTPYDALESDGSFANLLKHWEERNEPDNPNRVSNSFNGMVAPLSGYAFRGIIWYQGEANVGRGAQYRRMFPLMIESWRETLRQKNCPFYFVQPAPFRYQERAVEALPEIWDAQLQTYKNTANTGMIVTTDLGDPTNIHPDKKFPIANRLSNWALAGCYAELLSKNKIEEQASTKNEIDTAATNGTTGGDEDIVRSTDSTAERATMQFSGPIYESAEIDDNRIEITFRFSDSGLKINKQVDNEFTICGPDKKFVPAQAQIVGSTIVVSHPEIAEPVAARYGWKDTARPNLTNSDGLPASPFRTDDFPLLSDGVEF